MIRIVFDKKICIQNFCTQRIIEKQNKVVITDRMWARLLSSTNQPSFMNPKDVTGAEEEPPSPLSLDDDDCEDEEPSEK